MRITVCELPHEEDALATAWAGLCDHTVRHRSELVLLPEFAFVEAVWENDQFDAVRWDAIVARSETWMGRFSELKTPYVVGSRPATVRGRPLNQGYLWSSAAGVRPLRSKHYMPEAPGEWEARWFDRGEPVFPAYTEGSFRFGLNICTELWSLDTCAGYARDKVEIIFSPRASAAATTVKWLSAGVVAAALSGAFSVSSNRVDPAGACGGVGWITSPEGKILASTTVKAPFATVDIDLAVSARARVAHPCNIFNRVELSVERGGGAGPHLGRAMSS
jgi:N-carbamoylputrescine amidase